MPTLLLAGLLAGIVTSVSPCVLPVLPVVLTAAARRPWGVVGGLVTSFSLATLFGTLVLGSLNLPGGLLRNAGIVALALLGVGLIFPRAGELLERPFARLRGHAASPRRNGFVTGLALGLVYVPCAGPVLATIAVLGATHQIGFDTLLLTAAFGVGTGIPLLALAASGGALARRTRFFRDHARRLRAATGAALILVAAVTAFDLAAPLQRVVPDYTAATQRAVGSQQLDQLTHAPDFAGISQWLNTPGGEPLSLKELRGKVVVVSFWTYSCINCQRALPHLKQWYDTYRGAGLEVVGVHTPEFAFEHDPGNVAEQAKALGVNYPIAIDNDYATWSAYDNHYWPAAYLVDATGQVRRSSFGEGGYADFEQQIRTALTESGARSLPSPTDLPDTTPGTALTPETYLGSEHAPLATSGDKISAGETRAYTFPGRLDPDTFALGGTWTSNGEHLTAGPDAGLRLDFRASSVHLVLGGTGTVTVDGTKTIAVSGAPTLYTLLDGHTGHGQLSLSVSPGVQAYAFTFS
ncbi:cytochrome c biogenesis protein DipZ [Amycolatopsis alba]|uniref:Cytochrome c biogenesis protein DipZ n=1 Tax=Amycolatopsis alba DSM 44262 TaxID=1125972 RepID=A0A229S7R5_AMYAL|nr:cytochrome c biogenesis protein DipZ [Amycolatopsis alba]OXM54948.1 cytochrome c biogenesis protein DipZ [Amycolatopsis alba DSM 44262]